MQKLDSVYFTVSKSAGGGASGKDDKPAILHTHSL